VTKHQLQQHQKTGGVAAAGCLHSSLSALPMDSQLLLLSPTSSAVKFNKSALPMDSQLLLLSPTSSAVWFNKSALPMDHSQLFLLSPTSSPVWFIKSIKLNLMQSTSSTLPLWDNEVDDKDEEGADGKENNTKNGKKQGVALHLTQEKKETKTRNQETRLPPIFECHHCNLRKPTKSLILYCENRLLLWWSQSPKLRHK
jgi:hypothetical protein